MRLADDSSADAGKQAGENEWGQHHQHEERRSHQPRILYPVKLVFKKLNIFIYTNKKGTYSLSLTDYERNYLGKKRKKQSAERKRKTKKKYGTHRN